MDGLFVAKKAIEHLLGQNCTERFCERRVTNSLLRDDGSDKLMRSDIKGGVERLRLGRSDVVLFDLHHFLLSTELDGNLISTLQRQVDGGGRDDSVHGDFIRIGNDSQLRVEPSHSNLYIVRSDLVGDVSVR